MGKVSFETWFHRQLREKAKTTAGAEMNVDLLWGIQITLVRT